MQLLRIFITALILTGTVVQASAQAGLRSKADRHFENYAYSLAAPMYEKLALKKSDAEVYMRLGDCYRMLSRYDEAEALYCEGIDAESTNQEFYLQYAQMLQINGKFEEAIEWFSKYQEKAPDDSRAHNGLEACRSLLNQEESDSPYHVELHAASSSSNDMAPVWMPDGFLFSSSRPQATEAKKAPDADQWTGESYLNIYRHWKETGETTSLDEIFDSEFHDGPASFDEEKSILYFTRSIQTGKKSQGLAIFQSTLEEEKWTTPERVIIPGMEGPVMHPFYDAASESLYFVAMPENGFGGYDICKSVREGESWSSIQVMDETVNSAGDDMFPHTDESGQFWFSSEGRGGLGGLDIFVVRSEGEEAELLPAPLNSRYDDFSITWNKDGEGILSSNRPEGVGGDDLYMVFETNTIKVKAIVQNIDNEPARFQEVTVTMPDGTFSYVTTDSAGQFSFPMRAFDTYSLYAMDEQFNEGALNFTPTTQKEVSANPPVLTLQKEFFHVSGTVISNDSSDLDGSVVTVLDLHQMKMDTFPVAEDGTFEAKLLKGPEYEFSPDKYSYLPQPTRIESSTLNSNDTTRIDLDLVFISEGVVMEVENLYYDFAVWEMRPESYVSVQRIGDMLLEYPEMRIELASHTDSRATAPHNLKLSQKRSENVKSQLVDMGVESSRIEAMGYGETRLRNHCADDVECSEEEHQYNRRTEFRIISF